MYSLKDDAKKKGLMELIKSMYSMMDKGDEGEEPSLEHEALETPEEESLEEITGKEALDPLEESKRKSSGSLLSKSMVKAEDDLDMDTVKDFLTKKPKAPVGKSIKIMAIAKAPGKKGKKY